MVDCAGHIHAGSRSGAFRHHLSFSTCGGTSDIDISFTYLGARYFSLHPHKLNRLVRKVACGLVLFASCYCGVCLNFNTKSRRERNILALRKKNIHSILIARLLQLKRFYSSTAGVGGLRLPVAGF